MGVLLEAARRLAYFEGATAETVALLRAPVDNAQRFYPSEEDE
jgi:hypothetical protein